MRKEIAVGSVFLLALCLAAFGTIAVSGLDLFTPKTTWYVELADLSGLEAGNDVRVLGHRMGVVKAITFDRSSYGFILTLRMDADAPIHEGYRITVRDTSALGGRYLSVEPGARDRPPADTARLVGDPTGGDLIRQVSDVLDELKTSASAISEAKGTIGKLIFEDDFYNDLAAAADSLRVVAKRIEDKEGSVGKLIGDDDFHRQLTELLDRLKNGDGALARLMRDESGAIVDDLRSASKSMKSIASKIDNSSGTLSRLLNDGKLYADASRAVSTATEIVQDVRAGNGIAGMLVADATARKNVTETLDNVRALTHDVRAGQGTLGKLVTDDTLYNNVNSVAKDARETAQKINSGNGTIAKLINDPELYNRVKKLLSRAIDAIENARDSAPVSAIAGLILGPFQ